MKLPLTEAKNAKNKQPRIKAKAPADTPRNSASTSKKVSAQNADKGTNLDKSRGASKTVKAAKATNNGEKQRSTKSIVTAKKAQAEKIAKSANSRKQTAAHPIAVAAEKTSAQTSKTSTNAGKRKADGSWGRYPKSISRIETEKYSAWYVRIYYQGAYVRKTFSDTVYGGEANAYREALQWRDSMEERMGKPRTERSVRKKITAGERPVGIYRRNMKDIKRGRTYFRDVYEVIWTPEPGKIARTTISVTKHGEEEAYRKALSIRREKERQYYGGTIS